MDFKEANKKAKTETEETKEYVSPDELEQTIEILHKRINSRLVKNARMPRIENITLKELIEKALG